MYIYKHMYIFINPIVVLNFFYYNHFQFRGFAYLELKSEDMVDNAIDVMNGQELGI
jgi:RNA recognition motif-containing protein